MARLGFIFIESFCPAKWTFANGRNDMIKASKSSPEDLGPIIANSIGYCIWLGVAANVGGLTEFYHLDNILLLNEKI